MKIINLQQTLKSCLAASLLLFILLGCDSSDDGSGEGFVKLYNLSKDSPTIYLTLDEDLSKDSDDDDEHYEATYTGLGYGSAHSNISLENKNYEYQLAWQDEDSTDTDDLEVIYESDITILEDTIHLLVLNNSVLSPEVTTYVIPEIDDDDDATDDLFNLRVLNMHTNEVAIDLYISQEDKTFNEAELFSSVSYLELSDNQKLDQEDYIFYITAAGTDEVLFTSSSIPFYYASQNTMIVKNNNGAGTSSYSLDKMSDSSVIEYVDSESESQFSVYNAIETQDELVDYQGEFALHIGGVSNTPIIASLSYGKLSNQIEMASGDYSLDINTIENNTSLLSNALLSLVENTNQTIFVYSEDEYVDDDNDGDIDEDGDGIIDEIEVDIYTLAIDNSLLTSIYQHEVEIVNLIQSDDFSQVDVYFVRSDETINTATYSREVNYSKNSAITLTNNTYQVFVVAKNHDTSIILNSFELILNEDSNEQFLVLETSDNSPTGYKATMITQTSVQE